MTGDREGRPGVAWPSGADNPSSCERRGCCLRPSHALLACAGMGRRHPDSGRGTRSSKGAGLVRHTDIVRRGLTACFGDFICYSWCIFAFFLSETACERRCETRRRATMCEQRYAMMCKEAGRARCELRSRKSRSGCDTTRKAVTIKNRKRKS